VHGDVVAWRLRLNRQAEDQKERSLLKTTVSYSALAVSDPEIDMSKNGTCVGLVALEHCRSAAP
jgi:hypothetical protein